MDEMSKEEVRVQAGYVMSVANEFREFIMEQTRSGASVPILAAGIAMCLEECAKLDPGTAAFRTTLATLLKGHAR